MSLQERECLCTAESVQAVGPSSGASAHQQAVADRKKELNVDKLQYTAGFMLQFSEVRQILGMVQGILMMTDVPPTQQ